jgi:heptosyltransferase-1
MRSVPPNWSTMSERSTIPDSASGILVVRLGAMGDLIHALPAAASLKHSFPTASLTWAVEAVWAPLLEGNPFIDRVIPLDRKHPGTWMRTSRQLREQKFTLAIDFQGLLKSAFVASLARPARIAGFHRSQVREKAAALFYSLTVASQAVHAVDRNLDLAAAAGASRLLRHFPLPSGQPEGILPDGGFLLASPFAGWASKQWPLEYYAELARIAPLPLVLNGPPSTRTELEAVPGAVVHISSLTGLIDATRRATAVIGVDSGPMHLAAALNKPGVAIFGPTDDARNGPYGGSLTVLRAPGAVPRYQSGPRHSGAYVRGAEIDPAMRAVSPEQVLAHCGAGVFACPSQTRPE